MKNIIIVARGNGVSRVVFDSVAKKTSATDFQAVVDANTVQGGNRINALAVVNHTLRQLAEQDLSKEEPATILTLGLVKDMIDHGTPLFWLKTGKKMSGEEVSETELNLWVEFYDMMKAGLLTEVIFKDVATAKIPKVSKYPISMDQRLIADYVEQAWDRIKEVAPVIEVTNGDVL